MNVTVNQFRGHDMASTQGRKSRRHNHEEIPAAITHWDLQLLPLHWFLVVGQAGMVKHRDRITILPTYLLIPL
jgi:hypothetical protein